MAKSRWRATRSGSLEGFRFIAATAKGGDEDSDLARKAVRGAASRALQPEIQARLRAVAEAGDDALTLADDGRILWRGWLVATLAPGRDPLSPAVRAVASDVVAAPEVATLTETLSRWIEAHLRARLAPCSSVRDAAADAALAAPVRGILFQLGEALGAVPRAELDALVRACDAGARKTLARTRCAPRHRVGLRGRSPRCGRAPPARDPRRYPAAPGRPRHRRARRAVARGAPSIARDAALPDDFYRASGLVALGPRALAQGRAEALAAEARKLARQGAFTATPALRKLAGGSVEDLVGVLLALGFRAEQGPEGVGFAPRQCAAAPGTRERPPSR